MNKLIGIVLLAGGIVLLVNGFKARDSIESKVSQVFRGSPSDNAVWFLAGGAAATVAGAALILMPSKSK
jgi:hypothetical protein